MGVCTIDYKHVEGERRLGRAVNSVISDLVVRANGDFIVSPANMRKLQRAYELTFPKLDAKAMAFLKQMKRARRRGK